MFQRRTIISVSEFQIKLYSEFTQINPIRNHNQKESKQNIISENLD